MSALATLAQPAEVFRYGVTVTRPAQFRSCPVRTRPDCWLSTWRRSCSSTCSMPGRICPRSLFDESRVTGEPAGVELLHLANQLGHVRSHSRVLLPQVAPNLIQITETLAVNAFHLLPVRRLQAAIPLRRLTVAAVGGVEPVAPAIASASIHAIRGVFRAAALAPELIAALPAATTLAVLCLLAALPLLSLLTLLTLLALLSLLTLLSLLALLTLLTLLSLLALLARLLTGRRPWANCCIRSRRRSTWLRARSIWLSLVAFSFRAPRAALT